MAMRSEARVQAEAQVEEEEDNFGPQPLCRLEVCIYVSTLPACT